MPGLFLVAASLAAAIQLPKLTMDTPPQSLAVRGDPERDYYQRSATTFGSDDITVILIRDDSLVEPPKPQTIERMIGALEARSFVDRTARRANWRSVIRRTVGAAAPP